MINAHQKVSISCNGCPNSTPICSDIATAMENAYRRYWIRKPADPQDGTPDADLCPDCQKKRNKPKKENGDVR